MREAGTEVHLPVEIWAHIFLHLDLVCLRNVALTSTSFRLLARPFLYQNATIICEYSWEAIVHAFQTSQRRGLAEALDRLQFLVRPEIACLLRTCSLQFQKWPDPPFEPVLNFLCDHLRLFTNIRKLEFHSVLITHKRITDISTLSSLKYLVFEDCTIEIKSIRHPKISTRSLTVSSTGHPVSDPEKPCWLALVEPEGLLELNLVTSRATLDTISELTGTDLVLPHLRVLHLNQDRRTVCIQLSDILTHCPSLSQLHIFRKPESDRPSEITMLPTSEIFPCCSRHGLSVYDGPHFLISSFHDKQLTNLRRVRLFGDRWGETCDMFGIREDLQHLAHAQNLQSLYLRAFHTSDVCAMIAKFFPGLESLAFSLPSQTNTQDPMLALTREPFFESLIRMTLPSNLKHLVILGMIFSDPIEGSQVIEALSSRYDSLQHICLYFPQDFWMAWSKAPAMQTRVPHLLHKGVSICRHLDIASHWF
jgi:hypothetical protein